jgi:hypothetical protein
MVDNVDDVTTAGSVVGGCVATVAGDWSWLSANKPNQTKSPMTTTYEATAATGPPAANRGGGVLLGRRGGGSGADSPIVRTESLFDYGGYSLQHLPKTIACPAELFADCPLTHLQQRGDR